MALCSAISNRKRGLMLGMDSFLRSRVGMTRFRDIAAMLWVTRFLPLVEMTGDSVGMTDGGWVRTSSWMRRVGAGMAMALHARALHGKGCSRALITDPSAFRGLDCCTKAGPSRTRPHTDVNPLAHSIEGREKKRTGNADRNAQGAPGEQSTLAPGDLRVTDAGS